MPPSISIHNLRFSWPGQLKPVIEIEDFHINPGERVFLQGPSGSGKTTLLSLLAGILTPQDGDVSLMGQSLTKLNAGARDQFRADHVGFIFQQFNLIPYLSIIENITLACIFSRRRREQTEESGGAEDCARDLMNALGIDGGELGNKPVVELSVGQQQRVAAARALIGNPGIVIADEPTSALDDDNQQSFLNLLFGECEKSGTTLLFVSHDRSLGQQFDRQLDLSDL